ncbi:hypothetical protein CCICO_09020 [Corynebacterium ciconiae DSM 44920]|nr:hypothetical protein CCICO_09020 [Corynebacterium ciconiae DSM 44920]
MTNSLDFWVVSQFRRCSRPGCGKPAVATLTYAYAESTAVVGPLAARNEPHSWDLCADHAARITAPLGWEMLRVDGIDTGLHDDDEHLTALAEAVREVGKNASGLVPRSPLSETGSTTRAEAQQRARDAENRRHPARSHQDRPKGAVGKRHLYIVPAEDEES